jgi:hypothetical protein
VDKLQPDLFPTYIGGAVTELLFRATGTFITHRVFSLLGLLVATLLCCRWLRMKGFSSWIAGCVALLFCTEIHITRSAHFYRPDLWILALAFYCLLQLDALAIQPPRSQYRRCAWIGLLLAFQLVYWFSAVFSWPLILAEFLVLAAREKWSVPDSFRRLGFLLAGGLVGVLVLLILPFQSELRMLAQAFLTHPDFAALQVPAEASGGGHVLLPYAAVFLSHLRVFVLLLARSPFLWLLTTIGLVSVFSRYRVFAVLFLSTALAVIATNVYCFRLIYLLPFGVFFAAAGLEAILKRAEANRVMRGAVVAFCAVALCFGLGVSAVGVNLLAAAGRSGETPDLLARQLEAAIGKEARRVYIFSWQPYFVGRMLGWRLFSFLPGNPKYIFSQEAAGLLASMDYVLAQEPSAGLVENNDRAPLTEAEQVALRQAGFRPVAAVHLPQGDLPRLTGQLRRLIFAWDYPAFTVWKNQRPPAAP